MIDKQMVSGHRERLRKRYLKSGINGLQDYEIIELLLTYTVLRKDCKNIAKQLLLKYKNINNFFALDKNEFISNKNISERTYVLFRVIGDIIEKKLYNDISIQRIKLSNNKKLIQYLKYNLGSKKIEIFKVLFLNTQNELIKDENLFYGTLDKSAVHPREFIKKVLDNDAKSVILVHNHPSGALKPSESDILITSKLKHLLEKLEIKLLDHIIVSPNGYFSFLEGGIL
ncbi:MAG: DNA repair protein RadC [Fusobacteriales bacterium]|jgi:DNA repair protein RadC|nr:DNA repair protein RadC [Fusobacteriales bacterium]